MLGFAFTFIIGLAWGARYYRPELFASTEPFLILFFLFYVAIAVLFALRQDASDQEPSGRHSGFRHAADRLRSANRFGARISNTARRLALLALSGFYLLLAKCLLPGRATTFGCFVEAFIALGVVFGTLAIPLALDGRWTAAAWALEGAAIVWVGVRQRKVVARGFGIFLAVCRGRGVLARCAGSVQAPLAIFNTLYLGCVLISVAGLFSAW